MLKHEAINTTEKQGSKNYKSNLNQKSDTTCYSHYSRVFVADLTDFLLRNSSQDGIELEVFSASQQVVDGVKLGAVAHVLMHLIDLCRHTKIQ